MFAMHTQVMQKTKKRGTSLYVCVDEGYQGVSALECSCSSHTVLKLF